MRLWYVLMGAALGVCIFRAEAGAQQPPPPAAAPPPAASYPPPTGGPPGPPPSGGQQQAPPAPPPTQGQQQAPPPPGYGQQPPPPPGYGPQQAPAPPPVYGTGYPPPPSAYGPAWGPGYGPPAVMPYNEGDPVPAGYRVEERIRMGPFITGLAIGGTFYMLSVAVAAGDDFDNQKGWLLLPGLGPWITLATRDDRCDTSSVSSSTSTSELRDCAYDASGAADTLLVLDGILQATGVLLISIGVAAPRMVLVRDGTAELRIAPVSVAEGAPGLGLMGRF